MHTLRLLLAFIAGLLSKQLLVLSAGVLAARSAPSGYFQTFGAEHRELALGLLNAGTFAFPQFILGAAIAFLAVAALKLRSKPELSTYILGALVCHGLYMYSSGLELAAHLPHALWQLPAGPWAGWLGLIAGMWLYQLRTNRQRRAEA
jgi:hypothetical protein